MVAKLESPPSLDNLQKTRTLIGALNLVSRNLPLPPEILESVSSIYHFEAEAEAGVSDAINDGNALPNEPGGHVAKVEKNLITDLDDALAKQRPRFTSGLELEKSNETHLLSYCHHRLTELESLSSSTSDDLQMKCLLELYGLKLADLQKKVRSDVSSEYWLHDYCAHPDRQLYDWGLMRLRRPFMLYDMGDALALEADDRQRKKRDTERLSRLEEEEKKRTDIRKKKFFAELLDTAREFQLQAQAALKRRKQRNDGVQVTEQPSMLQGGELRSYQLEGLQWMLSLFNNNLNGILADEMGLGKTIQTISLIAYLMENKNVEGPHLIVAPKAVLPNWVNEFSTWAPGIMTVLYDGRLDERKAMREEYSGEGKFNVLITHYDLIMRDKAFLKKIHWLYMIVDEGHRLKNHECALAKTLSGYRIRRRLLLTGTPIQNSLQELWALLNFLLPSIFNSEENFEEWFNAPFADRCDVVITDEEELLIIRRLHHVIRPFLLRRKKDEVEKYLPGKTQVVLKCDLSAWQKVYYQQVTTEGRVGLDSGTGKSKSLQNLSMQLRKCCNHPYLFVGGDYNIYTEEIIRSSGKFELLDRLLPKLQRTGHRVLLFSQMTRLIDILEIYLKLKNYLFLRLDGSTKTEERGAFLKKFNEPDSPYFMFLLSTRAGGLGLNLQTADTVIMFDSDWNPQMDQQAEDRAHRIGQKKEVRVFVLVSVGSIEEEILERAKQKMGIDAKVIQAGLFNTTSTAQDRREMLQAIMRRGTDSLGADVPSEREINRLAARSDEEFWLFEKMDEERRQRENYRSRLMEEHEVPDWAYAVSSQEKSKGQNELDFANGQITGKRKRKEVVYTDLLSDIQWMKAVQGGEDLSKIAIKGKWREQNIAETNEMTIANATEQKTPEVQTENELSEGNSDDLMRSKRCKYKHLEPIKDEAEGGGENSWQGGVFTWKTQKRKRSSSHNIAQSSSSDGRRSSFQ
ncbi:probable ATP-dependent DNA helicase CHR12 isoform X2 [Aristolochia californica]|uniref:probable ATP-dependent DNA helicase CHR12 isoform X2 n=1 Tax=Aristolochia californica TaxID=171875 RepID=UPI0035DE114F